MNESKALRSLLFTPANRESALEKAVQSGADAICADLEDAVPVSQKTEARVAAIAWLSQAQGTKPWHGIRVNSLRTPQGLADLAALCAASVNDGFVLLPKVGAAADIQIVDEALTAAGSGLALGALVESAVGLEAVFEIARASERLKFLVFGGVDLTAELQVDGSEASLAYARGRSVHAAHAAGRLILDVPELEFRDADRVSAATARAKAHGFSGKAAIHPSNIAAINAAFTPSAAEVEEAKKIVSEYSAAPSGLVVLDGKLIEKPVVRAMQTRLALAKAAGLS